MFLKKTRLLAGAVAVGLAFNAAASLPVMAADNVLTMAVFEDIYDWDPATAAVVEPYVLANIYDRLVENDGAGNLMPRLATEWSVSDDGMVWTFKLREGVTFHDGTAFTSAAVKHSIERTAGAQGLGYIWAAVAGIETPDDHTVVISTQYPNDIPLAASAHYAAYIYSPNAATEDFAGGKASFGTGPYSLRLAKAGQQIVLDRNPDYWGGHPDNGVDRVVLKIAMEPSTRIQMMRGGEADIATEIPYDQSALLDAVDGVSVNAYKTNEVSYCNINHTMAPTNNINVRRAVQHLWDRQTIADGIYAGFARPAQSALSATHPGSIDAGILPFDVEAARQEIAASGLSGDDLKMTIVTITGLQEHKNAAILFQQNAAQVGLTVELESGDFGTAWAAAMDPRTAQNMFCLLAWPVYLTPSDLLWNTYQSESMFFNLSFYNNPEFDQKLLEAVGTEVVDKDAAYAIYADLQKMVTRDVAAILDVDRDVIFAVSDDVQGLNHNPAYNRVVFFNELSR